MMFKKNTAYPGFLIGCFIATSDGSEVTSGVPICKRILDGTAGPCVNAASYDATAGGWKIDLAAADLNGNVVGLIFKLTGCQPRTFTIKTVTGVPDANGKFPAALDRLPVAGPLVAPREVTVPALEADAIAVGDLMYFDGTHARPASTQLDQGSKANNQQYFSYQFLGRAMTAKATGVAGTVRVAIGGEFSFTCNTAAFEIGDYIGATENAGGNALEDQKVEAVANPLCAIGRVSRTTRGDSVTTVFVEIAAPRLPNGESTTPAVTLPLPPPAGYGGGASAAEVWSHGNRTLTGSAVALGPSATRSSSEIQCTCFEDGTLGLYTLVLDWDGQPITQSEILAITYTIYQLTEEYPAVRTPVENHENVAVAKESVIFDTPQSDPWASNYNFRHIIDVATHPAFTEAGKSYQIEFHIQPVSGQVIIARFRVKVI
jgi:hypothetical protein